MEKLTKEQAAIIGLYTGFLCGDFVDMHVLAEKVAGRSIYTHEFANAAFVAELKAKVKPQFLAICHE